MSMPVLPASPVEDTLLTAEQKKQIEERFEGVYVLEFIFSFGRRLGLFLTVYHRIRFNPCKEIEAIYCFFRSYCSQLPTNS